MKVPGWLKAIGRGAKAVALKVWESVTPAELEADIAGLAKEAVEYASGLDLNGDGRVATIDSILALAAQDGIRWGKRFAGAAGDVWRQTWEIDESELRRWAMVLKFTELLLPIIERTLGFKGFPIPTRLVMALLEAVLADSTAPEIEQEIRRALPV